MDPANPQPPKVLIVPTLDLIDTTHGLINIETVLDDSIKILTQSTMELIQRINFLIENQFMSIEQTKEVITRKILNTNNGKEKEQWRRVAEGLIEIRSNSMITSTQDMVNMTIGIQQTFQRSISELIHDSLEIELKYRIEATASSQTPLDLSNSQLVDDNYIIEKLPRLYPGLFSIYLSNCKKITEVGIQALISKYNKLIEIKLDGCGPFNNLTRLNLSNCPEMTEESILGLIKICPNLTSLDLSTCKKMTGQGIQKILSERELVDLNISGCGPFFSAKAVKSFRLEKKSIINLFLRFPSITSLHLGSIEITEIFIYDILKRCPKLVTIDVSSCPSSVSIKKLNLSEHRGNLLSENTINNLVTICPKLEDLNVERCLKMTPIGIERILERFPKLNLKHIEWTKIEELDLSGYSDLDEQAIIRTISFCKVKLKNLNLGNYSKITSQGIEYILNNCPKLVELIIGTAETLPYIRIEELDISKCPLLSEISILSLVKRCSPYLKSINLHNCSQVNGIIQSILKECPILTTAHGKLKCDKNSFFTQSNSSLQLYLDSDTYKMMDVKSILLLLRLTRV